MTDITSMHPALVERVLEGDCRASREMRRAVIDNAGLAKQVRTLIN